MISDLSATVSHIYLYPIKSLPRVKVDVAPILPSGALKNDRRWALYGESDKVVHSKKHKNLHDIQLSFDNDFHTWNLAWKNNQPVKFNYNEEVHEIENWFSEHLSLKVKLRENLKEGFPDDLEANGPTFISIESLQQVASWYDNLTFTETSKRFRSNIELKTNAPFWEDKLANDSLPFFTVGETKWKGLKICQRCAVPTRDTLIGLETEDFIAKFKSHRERMLPPWSEIKKFNHFYKLGINTELIQLGSSNALKAGDSLSLR